MMYGMTAAYGMHGQTAGLAGPPPSLPGQAPSLQMTPNIPGSVQGVSYTQPSASEVSPRVNTTSILCLPPHPRTVVAPEPHTKPP